MKKSLLYISALLLGMGALSSCSNDEVLPPVPEPEGGFASLGNGSWETPYSAYQCLVGSPGEEANDVWVTGYIVGWLNTDASPTFSLEEKSARIGEAAIPCSADSNLLISVKGPEEKPVLDENGNPVLDENGDPMTETVWPDWTECATVQLPSGAVRTALSLMQHPDNLGKQVSLKGTTGIKYCGVYGVKNTSNFNWGPQGFYEEPKEPIVDAAFTKVSAFDGDGQYLMVFNGNQMCAVYEPETHSYGALPVATVAVENDQITTSTLNAYTFTAVEGGYTIRDGYGRYLWRDPQYTNAYFQFTALPNGGDVWTVNQNADGTFKINNVLMNYSIQFSTQYSNVGCYSSASGAFPTLYKRNAN